MHKLSSPNGTAICYLGEPFEKGPLPTFVYFALSDEESLQLEPYNGPIAHLASMRRMSITIPGHGEGFDKFKALDYWAEQFALGHDLLTPFFERTAEAIGWLTQEGVIDPTRLALGGLSRGAFIAMHVASRVPAVQTLLGFAPLTRLSTMPRFEGQEVGWLDTHHLAPKLEHVKSIRFYIGNRDTLVGTAHAFDLMTTLVEHAFERRLKQEVDLRIYPSIGKGGHGTPPSIFEEGAKWVNDGYFDCHSCA